MRAAVKPPAPDERPERRGTAQDVDQTDCEECGNRLGIVALDAPGSLQRCRVGPIRLFLGTEVLGILRIQIDLGLLTPHTGVHGRIDQLRGQDCDADRIDSECPAFEQNEHRLPPKFSGVTIVAVSTGLAATNPRVRRG